MPEYGCFLPCEQYGPAELVEQARTAEQAGFRSPWISDHSHPWSDGQGQSPFVRSVIGALSEAVSLPVETAVTCPTAHVRLEVLEEAIQVMRRLFTGEEADHHGTHCTVENARLRTLPDEPVPIGIPGSGPAATKLAARVGDGYVTTMPDASVAEQYLPHGPRGVGAPPTGGGGGNPVSGGTEVCHGTDREECVRTVHRREEGPTTRRRSG
ncbi:F420-dependent glucose-6-phosphate dehydrogenase [Streptomyces sp. enrichment culture]